MNNSVPVVFDLDGTLVDTLPDISRSLEHAIHTLIGPGAQAFPVSAHIGAGVEVMLTAAASFHQLTDSRELGALYKSLYERDCAVESRPYPGVMAMLGSLKDAGSPLAILTNKEERLAQKIIAELFPADLFSIIRGARQGRALKPSAEGLHSVLAALGVAPGAACYVGDTCIDIRTAKAAGTPVVAVTWGYECASRLRLADPDRVCDAAPELPGCIAACSRPSAAA